MQINIGKKYLHKENINN